MTGKIVIVAGTSGAGKTTTCDAFVDCAQEPWMKIGVDILTRDMIPQKFGLFGARRKEGFSSVPVDDGDLAGADRFVLGDIGLRYFETLHEMLASASRFGTNVIVDHLTMLDPPVLQDCITRLAGLSVWFIAVKPPLEITQKRQYERIAGIPNGQMIADALLKTTRWLYPAIYDHGVFDGTYDSTRMTPIEIAKAILSRVEKGPGTAFGALRARGLA